MTAGKFRAVTAGKTRASRRGRGSRDGGEGGADMRRALLLALTLGLFRQAAVLREMRAVLAVEEWQGRVIAGRL